MAPKPSNSTARPTSGPSTGMALRTTYRIRPTTRGKTRPLPRGRGRVLPLVVGLILYVVLRAIPVLGPLVGRAVELLGLGAISHWIWTKLRRSRATASSAG